MVNEIDNYHELVTDIKTIISNGRNRAYNATNK